MSAPVAHLFFKDADFFFRQGGEMSCRIVAMVCRGTNRGVYWAVARCEGTADAEQQCRSAHGRPSFSLGLVLLCPRGHGLHRRPGDSRHTCARHPFSACSGRADAAADARSVPSAGQELTACHPGRDRVRLERNSMAPGQGLFQPGPELSGSALSRMTHPDFDSLQLAGRIPAALTHLDLGIVRT